MKLSRSLEFIAAFFKVQQVIDTRGGGLKLAPPPGPGRVKVSAIFSLQVLGYDVRILKAKVIVNPFFSMFSL